MAADPHALGCAALLREVGCLRDRIDLLEEENRQLKASLRPSVCFPAAWRLWPREAKLLAALYSRAGCVSYGGLRIAMVGSGCEHPENIVGVYLHHLRKKVGPHGIAIRVVRGTGLVLEPQSRAVIDAALAAVAAGQVA